MPHETLLNYLFKAVLTGNASLVVKALLAGADPNMPARHLHAKAHLVQTYDDNLFHYFEGTAVEFGFLMTHLREYRPLVIAVLVFFGEPRCNYFEGTLQADGLLCAQPGARPRRLGSISVRRLTTARECVALYRERS